MATAAIAKGEGSSDVDVSAQRRVLHARRRLHLVHQVLSHLVEHLGVVADGLTWKVEVGCTAFGSRRGVDGGVGGRGGGMVGYVDSMCDGGRSRRSRVPRVGNGFVRWEAAVWEMVRAIRLGRRVHGGGSVDRWRSATEWAEK